MGDTFTQDIKIVINGRHFKFVSYNIETDKLNITYHIPWMNNWMEISEMIRDGEAPLRVEMDIDKMVATIKDITPVDLLADALINKIAFNVDSKFNHIAFNGKMWEIKKFENKCEGIFHLEADEVIPESVAKAEADKLMKKEIADERIRRSNSETDGGE